MANAASGQEFRRRESPNSGLLKGNHPCTVRLLPNTRIPGLYKFARKLKGFVLKRELGIGVMRAQATQILSYVDGGRKRRLPKSWGAAQCAATWVVAYQPSSVSWSSTRRDKPSNGKSREADKRSTRRARTLLPPVLRECAVIKRPRQGIVEKGRPPKPTCNCLDMCVVDCPWRLL